MGCLLLIAAATSGCYLGHVAGGQLRLLWGRQSLATLRESPNTPQELRESLELAEATLAFARELGLAVGGQYTSYVEWPGDRVVTSVVATRVGELTPAGFWFPIVGRLPYKGFFDPSRAEDEAARLRARGYDVCVSPIRAYSTLGWFADPLTSPLLAQSRGRLVETLLHELVHATVFAPGDARLSEGLATFVGQEASVLLLARREGPAVAARRRAEVHDARQVAARLEQLRDSLAELYAATPDPAQAQQRRAALVVSARRDLAALRLATLDAGSVSRGARTSDACLALAGTYAADLPRYTCALAAQRGDLARFVAEWRSAADAGAEALARLQQRNGARSCRTPASPLRAD